MRPRLALLAALAVAGSLFPVTSQAQVPDPNQVPAGRETEAVVLTGANFPTWAALGDVALKANSIKGKQCQGIHEDEIPDAIDETISDALKDLPGSPVTSGPENDPCTHNQYEDPDISTQQVLENQDEYRNEGVPVDRLLGYKWNGESFEQIPFQVDEMFIHYLSNNNSGFSFYSETDQHTTYAFDREGFRWTDSDPNNPCVARPASDVAEDPVQGLDTDDELAFMARDAGDAAPSTAPLPSGIEDSYQVAVTDPSDGTQSFVYVMKAAEGGPEAAYNASNGYVRYERDADADIFLFSESNYEDYGATFHGPWYDPETGVCHSAESEWKQHRPGDQATITTPRYSFRYEGRWLMTELRISDHEDGDWEYGRDVIDQWKARAFQQRPGGETPCCGFEEEVNNWGGSSILMGELSGPVRTIRETWGADSGTNVVRREIFYRDEIRFISFLRVHVIPPGDGIYAQWDYNAGIMTRYYNPNNPEGVPIDGKNDDVGNAHIYASHDGLKVDPDGEGPQEPIGQGKDKCPHDACINNDVDVPDPLFSGVNAGLNWEQITGPEGTLVSRYQFHKVTAGSAHSVVTVPYYRDDSCFDDGTGSNPGPHVHGHGVDGDEPSDSTYVDENGVTQPREFWEGADPDDPTQPTHDCDDDSDVDDPPPPEGDPRYYQGSIGTHGVHILLIADSDNAHTTVPITEIDGDQRVVILPGEQPNVGERYGRQPEKPLVVAATLETRAPGPEPTESPTESPTGTPTGSPSETPTEDPTPAARTTTLTYTGDTAGDYSDDVTFSARLTDAESGEPLANEDVTFELTGADGSRSWTTATDADGVASQVVTLDRAPGSYQLSARYDGEENTYLGSADQSGFVIETEDTDLALAIRGKGSKMELVGTLSDGDSGAGVEGRTIEFFADGNPIGSATTGPNGTASVSPPPKYRNGHHDYEARFAGDDYYNASRARQRT